MLTKFTIELYEVEGVTIAPQSSNEKQEKSTDTSALESLFK